MVRPDVSWSGRYCRTLAMSCASCARVSSSQNTMGVPERRARRTARPTQSRTGASFTWHARHMSPASTSCCITTSPARFTTRTVPSTGISNVLSCEPYSSACCAISPTLGTDPSVAGSNAPWARQSSTTAA